MELTVTNRSRAYPGRSSGDSKVDDVQYVVLKACVHEWLSGGVSPCQGEGRGFECLRSAPVVAGERPPDVLRCLVLSIRCEKEEMSDGYLLFFRMSEPCRARTV